MRTLTSTLQSAQEAKSRRPAPRLVLTLGETSYTYGSERIIRVEHGETENSHATTVVLDNSDGALTDLDLQGYAAVLSHGLISKAGAEYSACPPLTVLGQKFDSYPGGLICTLQLIGIPDKLREDKASADYEHHWSDPKTVKDLITEVADGQPVATELTEKQETGNSHESCNALTWGLGQRLDITGRTLTKISFKLKKQGSPTGNITFRVADVDTQSDLATKVLGLASALTTDWVWYEVTLDTPLEYDGEVYLWCAYSSGDGSNKVDIKKNTADLKINQHLMQFYSDVGYTEITNEECVYRYKYQGAGIPVYSHCTAYEVVYDSEDALIDTYKPADSFNIKHGEDRLAVIDKLLYHTNCQRRFGADGKIHVFVPTTTGTTYDSEYSIASGHPFFSKALRKGLVLPNRIVVESNKDDESQYSGSATSAASYALLPVSDFLRTTLESDAQADSIAGAVISRLEIAAQQGGASVPVNCGAELYDYVKVTDAREGDSRTGNLGSISIVYNAERDGRPAEYSMTFGFGRVAIKGVAGTRISSLSKTRFFSKITKTLDNSIPWEELYVLLQEMVDNLHDVNVALGWVEGETPADEVVEDALLGYLKNVIEDKSPQLGGDLDLNGFNIDFPTTPNISDCLDEDDMASDSATALATQQSIKAYIDANAGIKEVNDDTAPDLGGDLNVKDFQLIFRDGSNNIIGYLSYDETNDSLTLYGFNRKLLLLGSDGIEIDPGAGETIDADTHKIVNVVDPTSDQDAATKKYVDDQAGGGGDMTKAVYDTDSDGVVDDSEKLGGSLPAAFAAASHTHAAADINSGTLDGDRLPAMSTTKKGGVPATGTPSGKYLKDDGNWDEPTGSGLENIVEDLTPELGGDLYTNNKVIRLEYGDVEKGYLAGVSGGVNILAGASLDLGLYAGKDINLLAIEDIYLDASKIITAKTASGYGISIKAGGDPTAPTSDDLRLESEGGTVIDAETGIDLKVGSGAYTTIEKLSSTQNDVTGSRSGGTVYQNTSGYLMLVNIVVEVTQGTNNEVYVEDEDATPDIIVSQFGNEGSYDTEYTHVFLVRPGGYYQLATSGLGSIVKWIETSIGD